MFSNNDREFLNNKHYSMALEKFFAKELELNYYYVQNDINRREKNVKINFAVESVYPFTNENLYELFQQLNVDGGLVATVGSSGDQMLAALLYGAKKVTLVDGNLYSKYFIDYKFSAIKNLTYDEFKKNFIDTDNYFDFDIFDKISRDLCSDSFQFWGTIFLHLNDKKEIKRRITNCNNQRPLTDFLYNEENYLKLQKILQKNDFELDFQIAEFNDFPNVLKETYDAILLSNVCQYVNENDYKRVVLELQNKLKSGGKIQLNYDFPAAFNKLKNDATESFKSMLLTDKNKDSKIFSVELGSDRIYFLEAPTKKESEPSNEWN